MLNKFPICTRSNCFYLKIISIHFFVVRTSKCLRRLNVLSSAIWGPNFLNFVLNCHIFLIVENYIALRCSCMPCFCCDLRQTVSSVIFIVKKVLLYHFLFVFISSVHEVQDEILWGSGASTFKNMQRFKHSGFLLSFALCFVWVKSTQQLLSF